MEVAPGLYGGADGKVAHQYSSSYGHAIDNGESSAPNSSQYLGGTGSSVGVISEHEGHPMENVTISPSAPEGKGAQGIESPHGLGTSFADRESLMDLLDEGGSDTASMSGYSAYSGKRDDTEPVNYYVRLVKFYQRYNPEKLIRVEEFLAAYKGEEEQLFQILSEKYGPEPDPPTAAERDEIASDFGGTRGSSHQSSSQQGGRTLVPKIVSAQDGNTQNPTPFWPGSKAVSDTDLLSLLLAGTTSNKHLQSCYLGEVSHPKAAWNGLTYLAVEPVPDGLFLGHLWSGSLANNKALVFNGTTFDRCVLHCSEECQRNPNAPHERWRLTMYRRHIDVNGSPMSSSKVLYRTVWDCELLQTKPQLLQGNTTGSALPSGAAAAEGKSGKGGAVLAPSGTPARSGSSPSPETKAELKEKAIAKDSDSTPFFSFSFSKRRPPPPPQPVQPIAPLVKSTDKEKAGGSSPDSSSIGKGGAANETSLEPPQFRQPHQPQAISAVDTFVAHIQALEKRLCERLDRFESRLEHLEREVQTLREKDCHRQPGQQ